jgi:UDP-N-acetylmuramate--alanine ligase
MNFNDYKHIHFIGIGGIGVSAVAKYMLTLGKKVSGSDNSESVVIKSLIESGAEFFLRQKKENISSDIDLVIYTIAIPDTNEELMEARNRGIKCLTYPESLSIISRNLETIAISGTHGKTTTTGMLAKVLSDAKLDPFVIIKSILKDFKSNLVVGNGKYFVVEACEYRRSFLNLYPKILVITNIDTDHLDYYKDLKDIQSAFRELAERIPLDGAVVCDTEDMNVLPVIRGLKCKIINYKEFLDPNLNLNFKGEHMLKDSAAVLAVANFLNLPEFNSKKSLESFEGTWRRFDLAGQTKNKTLVYDDYAHHPDEIKATLSGARLKYPNKKIVAVFQPHLFSRTKQLLKEFSEAFENADYAYILPIYAAREKFDESIKSADLVDMLRKNGKETDAIEEKELPSLVEKFNEDTIIFMIGAGSVNTFTKELIS